MADKKYKVNKPFSRPLTMKLAFLGDFNRLELVVPEGLNKEITEFMKDITAPFKSLSAEEIVDVNWSEKPGSLVLHFHAIETAFAEKAGASTEDEWGEWSLAVLTVFIDIKANMILDMEAEDMG